MHISQSLWDVSESLIISDCCTYPHQKLLGDGLSTPITPFSLICTISSELSVILDEYQNRPGSISQVLPGCRVRHPQYSKRLFVRLRVFEMWVEVLFFIISDCRTYLRVFEMWAEVTLIYQSLWDVSESLIISDCCTYLRVFEIRVQVNLKYGVATVSRINKITGLFCKRDLSFNCSYSLKPPHMCTCHSEISQNLWDVSTRLIIMGWLRLWGGYGQ